MVQACVFFTFYHNDENEKCRVIKLNASHQFFLQILMTQKNSHVPLGSEKVISYRETKKPLESSDDATSSATSSRPTRPKYIQSAHDVLQVHPNTRVLCNAGNPSFSFVLAHFSPELCQIAETKVINMSISYPIGDHNYYRFCYEHETRYWELDFLTTFATLQAVNSERSDTYLVDNLVQNYNCNTVLDQDYIPEPIDSMKTKFVTVMYRSSHFATALLDIQEHKIYIYDGLFETGNEKIAMWRFHVAGLLSARGSTR